MKEVHRDYVLLIRIGTFYYSYGNDAYIVAYLMRYKLNPLEHNLYACAFPRSAYTKVLTRLEEKKINYFVLDRRNNYEVEEKYNAKNLNQYDTFYQKAKEQLGMQMRVERIYWYLKEHLEDKELISQIEKEIHERRKI